MRYFREHFVWHTGTGKTLFLLCATLSWLRHLNATNVGVPPNQATRSRVVYSSRTHSQLAQVFKELRSTSYRVRMTILGSRQQLCVHPKISKAPAGAHFHTHFCVARKCDLNNTNSRWARCVRGDSHIYHTRTYACSGSIQNHQCRQVCSIHMF